MKFKVTLSGKDDLKDAIREAAGTKISTFIRDHNDDNYRAGLLDEWAGFVDDICREWFRDLEYLTVEIDTAQRTIRVVPN
jgi:hypothetical protein